MAVFVQGTVSHSVGCRGAKPKSLIHREDVWEKPEFLELVAGALNWTSGRIDADVTPNISQVTPKAGQTE